MIFHLPDRLVAATQTVSLRRLRPYAPFEKRPFTFGARSRTVKGVGRCSWALGPSTIDVRHVPFAATPEQITSTFYVFGGYVGSRPPNPHKVVLRFKRRLSAFRIFCPIQNSLRSDEVMSICKKSQKYFPEKKWDGFFFKIVK